MVGNNSIVFDECSNKLPNTEFGIGLKDNDWEFEGSIRARAEPMGSSKANFEILKTVLPEFIIIDKCYTTYAAFERVF